MAALFKKTKQIIAGGIRIGGGAPVTVQSMTNTDTRDARATAEQIKRLQDAGCEIIRVAIPDMEAAKAVYKIKEQIDIPLVCDIHFDYRLGTACAEAGADKLRINPGNIGEADRVKAVAAACAARSIPIRIGVNGGSLPREILAKYGKPCPEALVDSALSQIELLNRFDFDDICISLKSSSVPDTVNAYRLMSEKSEYPLHLGVTEAGTETMGIIKSAMGIGGLLCIGIGDTLRVSLTADPAAEVKAGLSILKAAGLRKHGVELISCPSCGRGEIDIISIAREVEERLQDCELPIKVAIMGCAVNGPGEAREADVGIAGGNGEGLIFRKGEIIKKVKQDELVSELMIQIEALRVLEK